MSPKNVVVTAYGAITPIGNNISNFSKNLFAGNSGAAAITHFDASAFDTKFACEVKNYNPLDFFDKKELRKYDLFTQYALIAVDEALSQANIQTNNLLNSNRIGVISASGVGGVATFQEEMAQYFKYQRPRYFSPYFVTKMIINNVAGHISIKYGFNGLNFSVASACASSAHAIITAVQNIQLGKADIIVVVGSEAPIHEAGVGSFGAMKALSTQNVQPEKASRPFDANRDGFVLGEGGACLVLESKESAMRRNAKILAEIAGYAMNADAYNIAKPIVSGNIVAENIENAILDANINYKDIDYINAHATSTTQGDVAEINAIQTVFKDNLGQINISATKSMTGHLLGAAGILESIISILSIEQQAVPPTINLENIDKVFDSTIQFTPNLLQKRKIDYVLNNNFGFGGHNASIIFNKYYA
jgi:3-oxoacyl-[acyl-carrier-protein] synthase II